MLRKIFSTLSIFSLLLMSTLGLMPLTATAAQFTGVKDTLSTEALNTPATHVITSTLVGGDTFATAETLTYDFVDADFTLNAIGNWQTADFAFNDGTARTITAVSTVSGVAPTCTAGTNNVGVTINTTTNTFVVTACGTYTASGANATATFTINGTTATGTGTMTNKTSDVDSSAFSIAESNGDTASGAVVAETNDVVNVTATVVPTLTFSNNQNAVDFGSLTSGAARYATAGAASGGSASSSTVAHTMTIGTNATTGYTLTYTAPTTLTNGTSTITAATITGSASGTPGSAQFALAATTTGTGTTTAGYEKGSNNWKFVTPTVSQIASATGPVSSDTVAVSYLANIPASQPAGNYAVPITYVVTGQF